MNNAYGVKLTDKDLKKIGKDDLGEHLIPEGEKYVEAMDLSEGKAFLAPDWGVKSLVDWARLQFNVKITAEELAGNFGDSHVRTIRRTFFNRPGILYQTPEALIVHLDPFDGQEALTPVIDDFNAHGYRLPWLENRQVVVSLTPPDHRGRSP